MIEVPTPGAARSFWLQEALAGDPGEPTPPLEGNWSPTCASSEAGSPDCGPRCA